MLFKGLVKSSFDMFQLTSRVSKM